MHSKKKERREKETERRKGNKNIKRGDRHRDNGGHTDIRHETDTENKRWETERREETDTERREEINTEMV